jgi:syntaxin-binding protein 1
VLELGGIGSRAAPNGLRDLKGRRAYQEFYDEKYYTRDAPPPKRVVPNTHALAPPKSSQPPLRSPQMSPSPSYADSTGSHASSGKDEKKKEKKHWFKF